MDKKLLFSVQKKDFIIQTFKAGGAGGQHQNKTDSGVRIIHKASGAVGECRNERSQHRNKRLALQRLTASVKFKLWVNAKAFEFMDETTIDQRVDAAMVDKNLKVEGKDDNGKWEIITEEE